MTPVPARRPPGLTRLARLAVVVALAAVTAGCDDPGPARATLSAVDLLAGADTAGFARAERHREFVFPADHGPHPEFKHEWWYFTGNLHDAGGKDYGFQLTFFRSAIRPDAVALDSDWATNQVYMAHFAITDVAAGRFHAFERFERGAMGLASARADPFLVHVGDWVASGWPPDAAGARFPGIRLQAARGALALDLVLDPTKPVVFQGDDGLSRKGPEPGNASYYYSLTRLAARGTLTTGGVAAAVTGWAWLDREWGTSALGPELEGWDWFSVQLDDRTELMFFQLRRPDGTPHPLNSGSFVHADGSVTRLGPDDVVLEATGEWRSPRGARYPSGWRLRVPRLDLELGLEPRLRDQELDLSFRYWEGAVAVTGRRGDEPVGGHGYVELTGYAERAAGYAERGVGYAERGVGPAPSRSDPGSTTPGSSSTRRPKNRRIR